MGCHFFLFNPLMVNANNYLNVAKGSKIPGHLRRCQTEVEVPQSDIRLGILAIAKGWGLLSSCFSMSFYRSPFAHACTYRHMTSLL